MRIVRRGITTYIQGSDLAWARYYCKERVILTGSIYSSNKLYMRFTDLRLAVNRHYVLLQFHQLKD